MSESRKDGPKRKKPRFIRNKGQHMKRLGEKWRRARGIDSKMRASIYGKPKSPRAGYGTNSEFRGLHPSGYEEVIVYNPQDLEELDSSSQAARIASKVGLAKKEEILNKADEIGIEILNR